MTGYEICVSRRRVGSRPPVHIFRTAQDSITSYEDAEDVARELRGVYPKLRFDISITYWEHVGREIGNWEV